MLGTKSVIDRSTTHNHMDFFGWVILRLMVEAAAGGVLSKNLAIVIRKHRCWGVFLMKLELY